MGIQEQQFISLFYFFSEKHVGAMESRAVSGILNLAAGISRQRSHFRLTATEH